MSEPRPSSQEVRHCRPAQSGLGRAGLPVGTRVSSRPPQHSPSRPQRRGLFQQDVSGAGLRTALRPFTTCAKAGSPAGKPSLPSGGECVRPHHTTSLQGCWSLMFGGADAVGPSQALRHGCVCRADGGHSFQTWAPCLRSDGRCGQEGRVDGRARGLGPLDQDLGERSAFGSKARRRRTTRVLSSNCKAQTWGGKEESCSQFPKEVVRVNSMPGTGPDAETEVEGKFP